MLSSFLLRKNLRCFLRQKAANEKNCCHASVRGAGGKEALRRGPAEGQPGAALHSEAGPSWDARRVKEPGGGRLLFRSKASRSMPHVHGASWSDSSAFRGGGERGHLSVRARRLGGGAAETRGRRAAPGRVGHCPHAMRAEHLQALLSSTRTARGLTAPVRFIWGAAEGASCSFTAPRLGFSSTRGFACRSAGPAWSLLKERSAYCRQSGSPSPPSERTLCWC